MKNATVILQVDRDDLRDILRELLAEYQPGKRSAELWTAREAAEALRLSESMVRKIGAETPGAIVRYGKAVRFDPDKLREAMRKQKK